MLNKPYDQPINSKTGMLEMRRRNSELTNKSKTDVLVSCVSPALHHTDMDGIHMSFQIANLRSSKQELNLDPKPPVY